MSSKFARLALALTLIACVIAGSAWADPIDRPYVPGEFIIKFRAGTSDNVKTLILSDLDATHIKGFGRIKSEWKRLGSLTVEEAIARYQGHPNVEFIEPNYILTANEVPNDPRYGELWGMNNTGQTGGTPGAHISAETAWDVFTGNPNIVVGVIDTGVDYNHPDLAANMWTNPGEIAGNGIDDDGNGYIDDIHGWDWVNDDGDPMDDNGHGSHCSGTIGGVGNNGVGVAGVNWDVRIMALKFLSAGGSGSTADAVLAIEYATDMAIRYPGQVRLTSNSWGGGGYSQAMYDAIEDAGTADMLFVAAAGNSSSNNDVSPHYPSNYALDNVIAVAATDHNDQLASFSSYGATTVDLAAPGVNILSTTPGNSYSVYSGTSMATPHVAGVAALTFGRFPAVSALDAKTLILNGADPLDNLTGRMLTGARLNAFWPIAEPDSIPPDPVTDLAVVQAGSNWLDIDWTATGDDGSTGDAARYDVRWSLAPINDLTWDSATLVNGEPDPGPPGTLESMRVQGLDFDTTYYLAVKVTDEFGNASFLSNVASGTTLGIPDIAAAPTSMSEALITGGAASQSLTLSNVGFGTLDFTIPTPTLLGDAVVSNVYVPLAKGAIDPRVSDPQIEANGGPDNYGYRWVDSNDPFGPTFAWVDISGVGATALSTGDDATAGPFAIGFDFPFYGGDFPEFRVCSNGFISLTDDSTEYGNQPLPAPGAPAHMIAPFWDDLDVSSGTVYYHNDGTRLIVQWDAVLHYGTGGPYTFQAILYPDGVIEYLYLDMGDPTNSATVGWQNGNGTDGHAVVFNNTYVENNLAVQIKAIPQWVTVTPTEGTIYSPDSMGLTVNFDASGLYGGVYDGIIRVLSNDPDEPDFQIPVQLSVTGAPDITVEPLSYNFGSLFIGATGETDIVVRNDGTDLLTISSVVVGDPAFSVDVTNFALAPRQAQLVHVTFNPAAAQPYSTTMTVTSDDPDQPSIVVDLSGAGLVPPEFAINPTSLSADLYTGETEMQTLMLTNSGGADFEWSMAVNLDADVTVYDAPDFAKGEEGTLPGILGAGGPDLYGYSWMDSDEPGGPVFDWVDITGVGTPVYSGNADDSNLGPFPIGFDFPFYGNSFSTFRVSSNGFISFTSTSSDLSNAPLPGTGAPENLLAVLHDDMYVDADIPSQVYYHYDGARLIVQFHNVRRYGQSDTAAPFYDMEAILYPSGRIVYQYNTVEAAGNTGCTIGIQNATQDDGLTVVYNSSYVHDGMAIRFDAAPEWLSVSPAAGVIPPGGSQTVNALFNAADLYGGTYTGRIHLVTNDPSVPTLDVPATLQVTGAPTIEVSTNSIDFGSQFVGYPVGANLIISNGGTDDLVITGWSLSNPAFGTNLTVPVTLGPAQALLVDMTFLPTAASSYSGTFTIASNAPTGDVVVDLAGVGLIAPIAAVSPNSLSADLFTGEQAVRQVTLSNSGGSDLTYAIRSELSMASVVVHESPDLGKDDPDPRPGILGSGGPDTFGYTWIDSDEPGGPVFNWVDISGTGTPMFTSTGDDVNRGPFPIGFDFPFYGNDFSEFRVSSNGWISFTNTTSDLSNDPLPASGAPENLLAVFWDDLIVDLGASYNGNVYYEFDGSRLIIQYDNVRRYGTTTTYTMQAILSPNGTILFQYLTMAPGRLNEATIGIQNATKDDGLTVVYNADYVHDNMAIRLGTTPDWLSTNPTEGVVPAGGSAVINVTFDASGLFGGAYDGAVRFETNDPARGLITIPAHLDVTGIPLIAVDPASLDFGNVYLTQSNTLPLTVSNPGTQTLHVSSVASNDPEMTADLYAFDIEPLQSVVMNVTFLAATAGAHDAVLTLTHDAGDGSTDVAMSAVGVVPPEIAVAPTSIEAAAMPGTQKVKTITICNEGGSDLAFSIGEMQDTSGHQVYTELVAAKQADEVGSVETVDPRPGILGSGGPDLFGYTWTDSDEPGGPVFDWVDISGVGTPIPFPSYRDDGNVGPVPLGFNFPFYENSFSQLYVSTNGWMSFSNSSLTSYSNQPLPNSGSSTPENLLAPFWDDMVYDESDGNSAYYYYDGTRFIAQFDIRRIAQGAPPYYEFQVILYPDGRIVYQYNTLGTTINSCTVGIQNAAKDDGLTVAYNDGSYLHEGLAVQFSSAPDWLAVDPASGVIPVGECMDVTVTLDATELAAGDYTGSITINSNDITDPTVEVPVLFHVGTIDALVTDAEPNTLNVAANGKYMTVYVQLPEGYDPTEVLLGTVMLNGVVPAEASPYSDTGDFNDDGIPDLMFKFDRSACAAVLPVGESVMVRITGEVEDTTWFVATDYIRVINPHMSTPNGGEYALAGGGFPIVWESPAEWNVTHADLFWTPDDGETWFEIARNVTGTSYGWVVPADQLTDNARVRVFIYDNQGLLGFDTSDAVFEIVTQITGVTPNVRPATYALGQNFPNPFNPRTTISFDLPRDENVRIAIYDVKGRLVKTLLSEPMTWGRHEVIWDGDDNQGNRVATGVYYYRISAGGFAATKSMVLVK